MDIPRLAVGHILELKKKHPCGCAQMKILRLGSDVLIECRGCARAMNIDRIKLEKAIRFIHPPLEENETKGENA